MRIPQRKGDDIVVSDDEGIRAERPRSLWDVCARPSHRKGRSPQGTHRRFQTAQRPSSSPPRSSERLQRTPMAFLGSHGVVARPDPSLHEQPAAAIEQPAPISVSDLDLVEINEAFAAVAVASIKRLGIDDSRLNVNGGAIALGHTIGMSGARLVLHLMYELRRRGGGIGAAALCGGGGQGDALIIEVPAAT